MTTKTSPAPSPRTQRSILAAVFATLVAGAVVSLLLAGATLTLAQRQERVRFDRSVTQLATDIRSQLEGYDEALYAMRGTIASNPAFDRAAFHEAVTAAGTIDRLPAMHALQLAVPVARSGGASFERTSRRDTIPGEPLPPVSIHPPLSAPVSFVVDYVAPVAGNDQAFGLNLTALPGRQEVIDEAIASGDLATSSPFSLVLKDGAEQGFVRYLAVYDTGTVPPAPSTRVARTTGLIVGVFTGADILEPALADSALEISVYDTGPEYAASDVPPSPETLLFASRPGLDPAAAEDTIRISNGERIWTGYVASRESGQQWGIPALFLVLGLGMTALLAVFVWLTGRARADAESRAEELAASERRFQQMSMTDPLTGLANRRAVMDGLHTMAEVARRQDEGMVVLFLDVDSFKAVNDESGHRTGDDVLRDIARRLSSAMRSSDLVGRVAGDEFCVAGLVSDRAAAECLVDTVQRALTAPSPGAATPAAASLSIGATLRLAPGGENAEQMLDDADDAMYEAKRRGGGQVVWYESSR